MRRLMLGAVSAAFAVTAGCSAIGTQAFKEPIVRLQDVRVNMPKGFIFKSAQAARTLVMKLFGAGSLSFDHSGQNAFYARLEFAGP